MCELCGGTGKIPFVNKKGETIPYTFLFCDCHPIYGLNPEPEHYQDLSPKDIDFPVSYSFHRSLCREHSWQDPGSDKEPEPPRPDPLPPILPEHYLIKKLLGIQGLAYNSRQKIQEHTSKPYPLCASVNDAKKTEDIFPHNCPDWRTSC